MSQRTVINERMRAILVDWLVQVHLRFRLLQETLFTTISILDRFLSVSSVHEFSQSEVFELNIIHAFDYIYGETCMLEIFKLL